MNTRIHRQIPILGIFAAALLPCGVVGAADAPPDRVEFRYAPPEWQCAICLPDDPQKTLVDQSGQLLYHYNQGGREFGERIWVAVASNEVWQKQELSSPRVPIVRTHRTAEGLQIVEEAFAVTGLNQSPQPDEASRRRDDGTVQPSRATPLTDNPASLAERKPDAKAMARMSPSEKLTPPRNDLILVHVTNTGTETRTLSPQLMVDTTLGSQLEDQRVIVNGNESVTASLRMKGLGRETQSRRAIQLESVSISPGKTADFFVLHCGGSPRGIEPKTVQQAIRARDQAIQYWQHARLPYGRIEVPDAGIQALLDSSIRNIWQAREIKDGLPAFQVGPTCYRGLWIVDGAFLLEAATMLGAGDQARNGVAYELTHQKPDGRIEVMANYWKENGIVLWTCVRHAQLTQDRAWLEWQWPKLERIAEFIKQLRRESLTNSWPLDDGLMPPGFPDGGIGGAVCEYTNPYWNLLGLRSFIAAARWLGKSVEAAAWQTEYDDFMAAFRKAAARDLRTDSRGHPYLPIMMGDAGAKELPQRAQWAFCHAVYPGQIFAKDDPLVTGNLAMLEATEREGMVCGTGWDATGIWNYFASFYAHAWLWEGNGRKAAQILYAYANHASPVLDWREEQSLRGQPFRKVGDMPHNWASAEFIRLTVHLLELDRGDELHLFEGLPIEWTKPGMVTKLNGIATPFGPLTLELSIARDGKSAGLSLQPLADPSCRNVVVHLDKWAQANDLDLNPRVAHQIKIALKASSLASSTDDQTRTTK